MGKKNLLVIVAGLLTFFGWAGVASAVPVQWGVNGHYYEVVDFKDTINWDEANRDAQTREHNGLSGHLVTLTSAEENDFVWQLLTGAVAQDYEYYWLGGYQTDAAVEPYGDWSWVTTEAWNYESWHVGEPNNNSSYDMGQNWLHYWDANVVGEWDDTDFNAFMVGYVVEYDSFGLRDDVSVSAPMTALLFAMGLLGIAASRARRHS